MAGRGSQTFKKMQKEQRRKEKREEKAARLLERRRQGPVSPDAEPLPEPVASEANVSESGSE